MKGKIVLAALTPNDWRLWRSLRLSALAEAPYAFGSRLADWQGPRDAEEHWRRRLLDVPHNVVAFYQGVPAGMASGARRGDDEAELLSMWVTPAARGHGVGDALVESVRTWAEALPASRLTLGVRTRNVAAIVLYRRHGFVDVGQSPDQEPGGPAERLMIVSLRPRAPDTTA